MRCRINYQTDPISLTIIAAEGKEHQYMDKVGHDGFLDVTIEPIQEQVGSKEKAIERREEQAGIGMFEYRTCIYEPYLGGWMNEEIEEQFINRMAKEDSRLYFERWIKERILELKESG